MNLSKVSDLKVSIPALNRASSMASVKSDLLSPNNFTTRDRSPNKRVTIVDSSEREDFIAKMTSPRTARSNKFPLKGSFGSMLNMMADKDSRRISRGRKAVDNNTEDDEKDEVPNSKDVLKSNKQIIKSESDYSTYLMYFPENAQSLSVQNKKKNFSAFKDLVKSTKSTNNKMLDNIIKENAEALAYYGTVNNPIDRVELVKKVLKFNKMQKGQYTQKVKEEKKLVILPLIKQVQDIAKRTPHAKILPSRKFFDHIPTELPQDQTKQTDQITQSKSKQRNQTNASPPPTAKTGVSEANGKTQVPVLNDEVNYFELKLDTYVYRFFFEYNYSNADAWKPEVREGHSLTTVGKKVVLYGGLSTSLLDEIAIYNPGVNLWTRPKVTGEIPLSGRHGHTACEYKKSLIIFGGEQTFNTTLNIRECLNDLRIFNPEKNEWKYIQTLSQQQINARRYHTAAIHERFMYVYAGVSKEGYYLKDLWTLHLKNFLWDKVQITGDKQHGIAFHAMCACYTDKTTSMSFSKDKDKERTKQKTYEEGIYVFGGKDSEGKILNTLKMFVPNSKVLQWKYPQTKGTPPIARYNHTMLFYEPRSLLIIYGGRNESLYETTKTICLNDIRILNLETMCWSQTTIHGDVPQVGRHHHAATSFGSKMLIFGGVELGQYANDEIKIVELNQRRIKSILDMDQEEDLTPVNDKKSTEGYSNEGKTKSKGLSPYLELPPTNKEFISFQPLPLRMGNESQKFLKMKLGDGYEKSRSLSSSGLHKHEIHKFH